MFGASCGVKFRDAHNLAEAKFTAKRHPVPMEWWIPSRALCAVIIILCSSSLATAEPLQSIEGVRSASVQSVSSTWTPDWRCRVSGGHTDGTHECG